MRGVENAACHKNCIGYALRYRISYIHRIILFKCIETNRQIGNITTEDAYKLKLYVDMLWRYLLKHHKELEAFGDMTDESFMTEADIICERLHKAEDLLKEKDSELQEREAAWQSTLEEKQMLQSTLQEKDSELQEKDAELERLRAELESLKNKKS